MILLPLPKVVHWYDEKLILTKNIQIIGEDSVSHKGVLKIKKILIENGYSISLTDGIKINYHLDSKLIDEQYRVIINEEGISFYYANENGAYNATSTFKQILLQSTNDINCVEIFDEPDFKNRGLMLDISRNRVFNVKTICRIIDELSDLKLNEIQFYIEGNAFYYPSKNKYYSTNEDYLTTEDIRVIDDYCKLNCIKLIPNQNSLGHMTYWLSQKEYNHLAECPDGFSYQWMVNSPPSTLNPLLKESYDFVIGLYEEHLEGFSEKTFNIGGDEPFELGFGASKEACAKNSKGKVYIDFLLKLKAYLDQNGYKMMMWGDVIKNHPELLQYLPQDIIALEWGYDQNDFSEETLDLFDKAGYQYYVCPGTSMWNSVCGIHNNMLGNIKRAAKLGKRHHAKGLLNTDWGDGGSWQTLSASWFPYIVGCSYSWNSESEQDELILDYLNKFIFKDRNNVLAQLLFDLGNSYLIEKTKESNATHLFKLLYIQQTDHMNFDTNLSDPMSIIKDSRKLSHEEYQNYVHFFDNMYKRFETCDLNCDDEDIVRNEVLYTLNLLYVGAKLGCYQTDLYSHNKEEFIDMTKRLKQAIDSFTETWIKRNKRSDFKLSIYRMNQLYHKFLTILNNYDIMKKNNVIE